MGMVFNIQRFSVHEDLARSLPAETLRYTYNPQNVLESRFIVNETASFRSSIQWVHAPETER